jgi:hypothetical protein
MPVLALAADNRSGQKAAPGDARRLRWLRADAEPPAIQPCRRRRSSLAGAGDPASPAPAQQRWRALLHAHQLTADLAALVGLGMDIRIPVASLQVLDLRVS